MTARRWANSIAGAVLGTLALVVVTAILTAAVSSVRANNNSEGLRGQIGALQVDNDGLRTQVATLQSSNASLSRQVTLLTRQNRVLVKYLRAHGLSVPQVATSPPGTSGGGGGSGPKVTHPQTPAPGTPAPTQTPTPQPSPSPGAPDLICGLVPALCP